ncbi:NUDIX domain-containing protein [Anaerovorax odorimutans]|uniref:NUDIX domain-containing protein n=1 Tax=Anaerovorax odorimutans TaxID=109327 RepID=UPI00041B41B7|nr:NUDIX hydrolase [Anaerovorax odorimutans]
MWIGGVRVIVPDEMGRILMVKQRHEGRDIWMVPGGAIEEGENALQAAVREVEEETGLKIKVKRLLWHVEEVSQERGQRFVNFFLAEIIGGMAKLGSDPEFDEDNQVLKELRFFTRKELCKLPIVYPEYLKTELWEALEPKYFENNVFKIKD